MISRFCSQKRPLIGQPISSLPIRGLLFFMGKLRSWIDPISEKKLNLIMSKLNKHLKKECKQIRYLGKFGILWNKLHIGNNHVQSSNVASFWNMLANMKDILDSESILIQWHSCGCSTYVFWTLADIPVCNIPDNSKYYFDVIEYVSFWNISLFLFREN